MQTGFIAHVDPQTGEITRLEIVARTDQEAALVRQLAPDVLKRELVRAQDSVLRLVEVVKARDAELEALKSPATPPQDSPGGATAGGR